MYYLALILISRHSAYHILINPELSDHLSYVTLFQYSHGRLYKTRLTVIHSVDQLIVVRLCYGSVIVVMIVFFVCRHNCFCAITLVLVDLHF
jgi:hypothetical protein